ncbi:MAG: vitamin K-dependent gamma-carboxylase [Anaerolineaceae bacterium]|nr:vitamin K-dependent gamma-carboxylase [Anaerolineaceae bacterium]
MSATLESPLASTAADTARDQVSIWQRLFVPVAAAPLVFFRIAFGGIMLWEVWRYFNHGWIARYFIEPTFYFGYFGFEWVRPWPGDGMYLHFYLLGLLAVLIILGLFYRISALLFFLGFTYVFLLDQTNYLNHFYLIALVSFAMIFVPATRALSLDGLRKPNLRSDSAPAWTVALLRFLIGIAYFYGGIAKINGDWLQAVPMRYWLAARRDFPLIGQWFGEEWMAYLFSYGGLFFDLLIVPLLLWRRTRTPALIVATLFHVTNAHLFSIGIFPWFMIAATWILFGPDWLRHTPLWKLGGVPPVDPDAVQPVPALNRRQRWVAALLTLFVVWQVLMPLRHWLYPGYVSWTEEGHNFSWHMKLRGKDGDLTMYVFDKGTYTTEEVNLSDYLSYRQVSKMATRPHMVHQFAYYLADQLRAQGRDNFSIHARNWVALNGRDWQLIIDPQVDLASQPRDIWHKPWLLPLETPLIIHQPASADIETD